RPPRTMQFLGLGSPAVELETTITRTRGPVLPVDPGHEQHPFAAHGALPEATATKEGVANLEIHEAELFGMLEPQGKYAAQGIPEPFPHNPMRWRDRVIEAHHGRISPRVSRHDFPALLLVMDGAQIGGACKGAIRKERLQRLGDLPPIALGHGVAERD